MKKTYNFICRFIALLLVMMLPFSALAAPKSASGFYFDTVVVITVYGDDKGFLTDMHGLCSQYERLLSRTMEGSDVWAINHAQGQPVTVSDDTMYLLRLAKEISAQTEGAFSMTIAPISMSWDFTGGTHKRPTAEETAAMLPLVDDSKVILGEDNTVTLPADMRIDLGGIAKGYIADKMAEEMRNRGLSGILNFGGNVYCVGAKEDGSLFRVGITDPFSEGRTSLLVVSCSEATTVTSGTYERYFEEDGVRYHHILDPKTGMPSTSDLVSVSLIGSSSAACDAYATAGVVLGLDKALPLFTDLGLDALFITQDGQVVTTPGFEDTYPMQMLSK